MKQALKKLRSVAVTMLAAIFKQPDTAVMANSGSGIIVPKTGDSFDFRAMVCNLLGIPCDAQNMDDMVNERYKKAMEADDDDKTSEKCNEAVTKLKVAGFETTAADPVELVMFAANSVATVSGTLATTKTELATVTTTAANEKQRADKATTDLQAANEKVTTLETQFANERKARTKELLDAAVTTGRITKAERKTFETEMANVATFDGALAKLAAKQPVLPNRGAGLNLGDRREQHGQAANSATRIKKVQEAVQEVMAANQAMTYDKAFAKVQETKPELFKDMKQPDFVEAANEAKETAEVAK